LLQCLNVTTLIASGAIATREHVRPTNDIRETQRLKPVKHELISPAGFLRRSAPLTVLCRPLRCDLEISTHYDAPAATAVYQRRQIAQDR
jgi:hypothetical protein